MTLTGESEILNVKPVQIPLCPPQISHGLVWNRTRVPGGQGPVTACLSL
jgi:hypothetical protein